MKLFRSSPLPLLCVLAACESPTKPVFPEDAGTTKMDAGAMDAGNTMVDAAEDRPDAKVRDDAGGDSGFDAGPQFGLDTRLENLTCTAATLGDNPPTLLSATGCLKTEDPTQPVPALIPFELNAALWSDGSDKRRWMALPDGEMVTIGADGDLTFPIGTVMVKEFAYGAVRLETRLFAHYAALPGVVPPTSGWRGFSYKWRPDGSDAELVPDGPTLPFDVTVGNETKTWKIPTREECMTCHNAAVGRTIGPEIGQLNRDYAYPTGRTDNQLSTLSHIGVLGALAPLSTLGKLFPYTDETASLDARARAYLHVNCAMCHQKNPPPGFNGPGEGPDDFRVSKKLSEMGICEVSPSIAASIPEFGLTADKARILAPGDHENSILWQRMNVRWDGTPEDVKGKRQMPPIATRSRDEIGITLIRDWIESYATTCSL